MASLVRAVGACSGKDVDKFEKLGIKTCVAGWQQVRMDNSLKKTKKQEKLKALVEFQESTFAVKDCIAHIICSVESTQVREGHNLHVCQMRHGWVRASHWSGKTLRPQKGRDPILTFLGSQEFGYIVPMKVPQTSSV